MEKTELKALQSMVTSLSVYHGIINEVNLITRKVDLLQGKMYRVEIVYPGDTEPILDCLTKDELCSQLADLYWGLF